MLAAIDLGSNSFRLHIGIHNGEEIRIIKSARDPIRLASGLDSAGNLTPQAMQLALESLSRFAGLLKAQPLDAVRVVATNTVRIARNAPAFLPMAEKAIGYPIEVISGEEEGRLIYMGVAGFLNTTSERRLVIDIGGGSTELALGSGEKVEAVASFSIGTVHTGRHFFSDGRISAAAFEAAVLSARGLFEDGIADFHPRHWHAAYGSSGTMRTLAEVIEKNAIGDGSLSTKNLKALKERLLACGSISKIDLQGFRAERLGVILGGLPILLGLCEELGLRVLKPIDAGLRMGVLWDLHLRANRRDRRDASVTNCMQRFGVDDCRAQQVADMSAAIYAQTKPEGEQTAKLLYWSGKLHEIGLAVSHTGFHKHGAYLAEHADLPGFTKFEQKTLSTLLLAQKGNLRKVAHALAQPDFAKAIFALRMAIIFMHTRIGSGNEDIRYKMKNRVEVEITKKLTQDHPTLAYWLAREQEDWRDAGWDFMVRVVG